MSRCTKCRTDKEASEFSVQRGRRRTQCKACRREIEKGRYGENPTPTIERTKAWKKAHPQLHREQQARWRARDGYKATLERRREKKRAEDRAAYRRDPEPYKERARRRQAKMSGAKTEVVRRTDVFERDGWTCQLCHEEIGQSLRYPDPMSASVDHIVPLSLGGEHSMANVQAAHLICNRRKGTRLDLALVSCRASL